MLNEFERVNKNNLFTLNLIFIFLFLLFLYIFFPLHFHSKFLGTKYCLKKKDVKLEEKKK